MPQRSVEAAECERTSAVRRVSNECVESAFCVEEELFAYQKLRLGAAPAQNTVPPAHEYMYAEMGVLSVERTGPELKVQHTPEHEQPSQQDGSLRRVACRDSGQPVQVCGSAGWRRGVGKRTRDGGDVGPGVLTWTQTSYINLSSDSES